MLPLFSQYHDETLGAHRMSTTHRATFLHPSQNLPLEIVDLIIGNECLSSSDLYNTSLVSRVWTASSQRRLFSSVELDPESDHALYRLIPDPKSKRLIRYIKHLTLSATQPELQGEWAFPCDDTDDALVRIEDDPELGLAKDDNYFETSEFTGTKLGCTRLDLVPDSEATASTHRDFPTFLRRLTNLEKLTVKNRLNFYVLSREALQAFFHIFSLDTFRYLDIWRSGLRLPFTFFHFCYNIEYLSLNVWPTTTLELQFVNITKSERLALSGKQAVRPTALKMIDSLVVHSWSHYLGSEQLGNLGNPILLDRLRNLYIAYDEEAFLVPTRGVWPSKYVCEFLSSFGHNLEELVLEVDHRRSLPGLLSQIPHSTADVSVPASKLSSLTNLTNLRLHIYNGTLPELSFTGGFPWVLLFLKALPNPSNLIIFQFHYVSTFAWTTGFKDKTRDGEELLDRLFDILDSSFTGLKAVQVQMKLTSLNGPSPEVPPTCDLTRRDDYVGLRALKERKVHTRLRIVLCASVEKELDSSQ